MAQCLTLFPGPHVLRIRAFRDLWMAQTVSMLGDSIYFLVFLFMAKEASRSNLQVGLVMTASAVPFLLLSPFAGVIADRLDRRWIMAATDFTSALLMLGLAVYAWFEPVPPIAVIGSMAFLLSSVAAFFMPARMAALPRLVPGEALPEANAFYMTTQQIMWMVGMAASATLLALIQRLFPERFFCVAALFNAATFLFSSYWVLRLPNLRPDRGEHQGQKHGLGEFKEGVRAVLKDPVLRIALPTNVLAQAFISGFMVAYLEVNKRWFSGTFGSLAVIELSFAVTMAACGLYVGHRRIVRPGLSFCLATGIVGVSVVLMAWSQKIWLFMLCNALAGIALPFAWIPIQTYIQSAFEDRVRGRVSSVWIGSQMSVQPIGTLCVGPMLDWLGAGGAFLFMGGGMALSGFAGLASRACREAPMPSVEPEPQAV